MTAVRPVGIVRLIVRVDSVELGWMVNRVKPMTGQIQYSGVPPLRCLPGTISLQRLGGVSPVLSILGVSGRCVRSCLVSCLADVSGRCVFAVSPRPGSSLFSPAALTHAPRLSCISRECCGGREELCPSCAPALTGLFSFFFNTIRGQKT